MPLKCFVGGCGSRISESPGITFHRFPKRPSLSKVWQTNLGITSAPGRRTVVCSRHFRRDRFNFSTCPNRRVRLKRGTVPTENLVHLPTTFPHTLNTHTQCDGMGNSSEQSTVNDMTVKMQPARVGEPKSMHLEGLNSRGGGRQEGSASHTERLEACVSKIVDPNSVNSHEAVANDYHSFENFSIVLGPDVTCEEGEDPSTCNVDMEVLPANVTPGEDSRMNFDSASIAQSEDRNSSLLSDKKLSKVIDVLSRKHQTPETPQDGTVLSSLQHPQQEACPGDGRSFEALASGKHGDESSCESPNQDISDSDSLGDHIPEHDSQSNDASDNSPSSPSSVSRGGNSSPSTAYQVHPTAITVEDYTCSSCNCEFSEAGSLAKHKCNNSNEDRTGGSEAETLASTDDRMGDLPSDTSYRHDCEFCRDKFTGSLGKHHNSDEDGTGCDGDMTSTPRDRSVGFLPYDTRDKRVCKLCGERFPKRAALEEHYRKHDSKKPYQCFYCKKCFRFASHLKYHYESHTTGKQYQCKTCARRFKHSRHLEEHEILHTKEKAIKCEVCGKLFAKRRSLKVHMIAHTEERPCQCSICGKTFKTTNGIARHEGIHRGEKWYKCQHCPEAFSYIRQLRAHERKEHREGASCPEETPYQCQICAKYLSSSGGLLQHVRAVHKGERPHACQFCDKTFKASNHLKVHEMIHLGERPFACEDCGKAFITNCELKKHTRIHSGECPYRCLYCEKAFTQSGALNGHIRRKHTTELTMPK